MINISEIGNLNAAEPLDLSMYKDAQAGPALPKAGIYQVKAPDSFPVQAFGATKAGNLSAQVDPTIVGPTNEGYTLRFTKVSAKVFDRKGTPASQLGDYLRAFGDTGRLSGDPQEAVNRVEMTAGAIYEVEADWEARHSASGYKVTGMRNFPSDGNGGHQPFVTHPSEKGEDGEPLRLRANLVVRRYLPRS